MKKILKDKLADARLWKECSVVVLHNILREREIMGAH